MVCHKTGTGKADEWQLGGPWGGVFQTLAKDAEIAQAGGGEAFCDGPPDTSERVARTFPETSDPPSQPRPNGADDERDDEEGFI